MREKSKKFPSPEKLTANRVLVIDDDPLITKVLEKGLANLGYTVSVGRHGQDAAYLVLEFKPDVVILDIMLPDIDGEEICKRIRASSAAREVKIISMSAISDDKKIAAMHAAGINLFIPKPFQIANVAEQIRGLVGPIRQKETKFIQRNMQWMLAGAGLALIITALGFLLWYVLRDKPQDPAPITPPVVELTDKQAIALSALAKALASFDKNADGRVTALEAGGAPELKELDKDGDGSLTRADGLADLQALLKDKSSISREEWVALGASAVDFAMLDLNKDGALSPADLATVPLDVGLLPPSSLAEVTDRRNGRKLALDQLRAAWLEDMTVRRERGQYLWRGMLLPASAFGGDTPDYGLAELVNGTKVEGFRVIGANDAVQILDTAGQQRHLPATDISRWTPMPSAPPIRWYRAVMRLAPHDSAGWAELAREMSKVSRLFEREAADAARHALIYDLSLADLYAIAGVELKGGELKKK